jgi:hypothetical protein
MPREIGSTKPQLVSVFVSHSWAAPDQYQDLMSLLESVPDLSVRNVSIDREYQLRSEADGEPAQFQELAWFMHKSI